MAGPDRTLWTAEREVPLHTRDVEQVTPREMRVLADLDALAKRLKLVLVCGKCDHSFAGGNSGDADTCSIWCRCREIRGRLPAR